jgi:hypothetical protein
MEFLAAVVDTGALLKTVAASLVAGIGVTFAFALAILGAARFIDMRSEERSVAAGAFAVLAVTALGACGLAIAFGIIVMTSE